MIRIVMQTSNRLSQASQTLFTIETLGRTVIHDIFYLITRYPLRDERCAGESLADARIDARLLARRNEVCRDNGSGIAKSERAKRIHNVAVMCYSV